MNTRPHAPVRAFLLGLTLAVLLGLLLGSARADAATNFTYTPASPLSGDSITFTADDQFEIGYTWEFDGTADPSQMGGGATHAFTGSGPHTARLTTAGPLPTDDTQTITLADRPPTIGTVTVPKNAQVGAAVTFSATATDPDGDPLTYDWTFEDGTTGTGATVSHTYAAAGAYSVTVTVRDVQGEQAQTSKAITIVAVPPPQNKPPTVVVGASTNTPAPGVPVSFFANATDDQPLSTLTYRWDFGDGTTATTENPAHAYARVGFYTVKLTATDAAGATAFDSDSIIVRTAPSPGNAAPHAAISQSPAKFKTGQKVKLTAVASDPDGTVSALAWDLDDDGVFGNDLGVAADGRTATLKFTRPGRHIVHLRVTDNLGASTIATRTLTAINRPPVADLTFSPAHPRTGDRITLVSLGRDPDGPVAHLRWDLDGDGQFHNGTTRVTHVTFKTAGKHRFGLQVTDADGAKAVHYTTISVRRRTYPLLNPFPVVEIVGSLHKRGAQLRSLNVRAPRGSRVRVACYGRKCPVGHFSGTAKRGRSVHVRSFQRMLPAGVRVVVKVTKSGRIGKYTSFLFRSGSRAPSRRDLCLVPGHRKPSPCP